MEPKEFKPELLGKMRQGKGRSQDHLVNRVIRLREGENLMKTRPGHGLTIIIRDLKISG